jgi:hypothetical protein
MTRSTSLTVARFFECISRFLQAFANRAFSGLRSMFDGFARGLCTMFNGFTGGLCAMLNRLPRFGSGLLYSLASLFNWTLILGSQNERKAE